MALSSFERVMKLLLESGPYFEIASYEPLVHSKDRLEVLEVLKPTPATVHGRVINVTDLD